MLSFALKRCVLCTRMRQSVAFNAYNRTGIKGQTIHYWAESKYSNITGPNVIVHRFFNTQPQEKDEKYRLPPLMWQPVNLYIFPVFDIFFSYWSVRLTVDKDFRLREFFAGAKQAVLMISSALASQNYDALDGLVKEKAIKVLRRRVDELTPNQREYINIRSGRLIYMPAKIRIIIGKENVRIIEVTIFGICAKDASDYGTFQENVSYFSYIFQRKYTNGIGGSWIVRVANHFA